MRCSAHFWYMFAAPAGRRSLSGTLTIARAASAARRGFSLGGLPPFTKPRWGLPPFTKPFTRPQAAGRLGPRGGLSQGGEALRGTGVLAGEAPLARYLAYVLAGEVPSDGRAVAVGVNMQPFRPAFSVSPTHGGVLYDETRH